MKPVRANAEEITAINARVKEVAKSGNPVEFERLKVVQAVVCQGMTRLDAARAFNRNRFYAEKWVSAYVTGGLDALKKRPYPGKGRKLSDADRDELKRIIIEGAEAAGFESNVWTGPRVQKLLLKRFGVKHSVAHIRRILHDLGFSVQFPRQKLSKADLRAQEQWLAEDLPTIKKKPERRAGS